jgi:hypothetical protein
LLVGAGTNLVDTLSFGHNRVLVLPNRARSGERATGWRRPRPATKSI